MTMLNVEPMSAQQEPPPPPQTFQLNYAELGQLVAPIALYPDALVAQVLAAATYVPQVVEADTFVHRSATLPPQELARLVNIQPWDPSVKALTAFPSVLDNMNRNLQWTTKLGNAYYNQPQDVMSAIQTMRERAYKAGTLRSTPQLSVGYQPGFVVIQPVDPAVFYVPVYNPWVVYGAPLPVYPAYYVAPAPASNVAVAAAIGFSAGVAVAAFSSYGWGCPHWSANWYSHTIVYGHATYVSRSVTVVNHGYYGHFDHSPTAVAYNHQVFYGPQGVTSRTAVRGNGQTYVHATGPYGNSASRSTSHYPGGNSTTVVGPGGQSASRSVNGRGSGYVSAITTGPNGGTTSRSTNHYAGGSSTSITTPNGATENTTVTGRGTGHATVTRSGARGNGSRTRHP